MARHEADTMSIMDPDQTVGELFSVVGARASLAVDGITEFARKYCFVVRSTKQGSGGYILNTRVALRGAFPALARKRLLSRAIETYADHERTIQMDASGARLTQSGADSPVEARLVLPGVPHGQREPFDPNMAIRKFNAQQNRIITIASGLILSQAAAIERITAGESPQIALAPVRDSRSVAIESFQPVEEGMY